jgi:hypothetical protein
MDNEGGGATMEGKPAAGLSETQEWELAHFMGRLYERASKLLAQDHGDYMKPGALDLELGRFASRRESERPKWLSEADADGPIRKAAGRAIQDFRAGIKWGR